MGYTKQGDLHDWQNLLAHFNCDEAFLKEITENIRKHHSVKFISVLLARLKTLKEYKQKAILCEPKNFESLKHTKSLYSMRVKTENINYRILYSFQNDGTILLHGFEEKKGKKVTEYSKASKIANSRLKNWEK